MIATPVGKVILSGARWRPNFLLRDDFNLNASAPLASPRTAEPTGTLTLVQADGQFSISGGKLNFPAQASPAWTDQGFYGAAQSRVAGRTLLSGFNHSSNGTGGAGFAIWKTAQDVSLVETLEFALCIDGSSLLYAMSTASTLISTGITLALNTEYQVVVSLRSAGAFLFLKGGAFTNWTLVWVGSTLNTATLYPTFSNYDAVGTLDTFRVLDLPAPFTDDYGIATQRLAGARTAPDAFTHEADCVIEWTQTTLSSGNTDIYFRKQDSNNYWIARVTSTGSLDLKEVIAGGSNSRAAAAGVVSNGHRIVFVAEGSTIRGYSNNVLRWTYSSASNFATATAGKLQQLGTGGAVSDIVAWPRTLTGAAASLLDSAVA